MKTPEDKRQRQIADAVGDLKALQGIMAEAMAEAQVKTPFVYKDKQQQMHFEFLDALRSSGVTNMYGGAQYLRAEFPRMERKTSFEVLADWMKTFEDRGCPGRDD